MIRRCSSSARRAISGASTAISAATISPRPRTETTFGSSRRPSCSRSPRSRTAARNASSSITSSAACAATETTGPPANVEPWSPGREHVLQRAGRSRARRSAARRRGPSRASSRPGRRRPARRPTACRCGPSRTGPRRTRAPRRPRRRPRATARSTPVSIRFTPDSPWTGSISTAAVMSSTASGISAAGDRAEARHERRERRLLGLLRRRRQRAVRAAVERAVGDDDVAARARLAHELDRRLVGLGAGVAEEHDAAERALAPAAPPAARSARW